MNTGTKRRKRHRANAKLKFGDAAVRKHMRKSGRTGGIWKKRTHGKGAAQRIEARQGGDGTAPREAREPGGEAMRPQSGEVEVSEWRDISEAPRNGRWIWLTGGQIDEADNIAPDDCPPAVCAKWSYDGWLYGLADCGYRAVVYKNPTHWAEVVLPPPPGEDLNAAALQSNRVSKGDGE